MSHKGEGTAKKIITPDTLNAEAVVSIYEAAVELTRADILDAKKNIKKGYPDTPKGLWQEERDIETLTECTRFLFDVGFKDRDIAKAMDKIDAEVDEWYRGYCRNKGRAAAREWLAWGMCLDDDVY